MEEDRFNATTGIKRSMLTDGLDNTNDVETFVEPELIPNASETFQQVESSPPPPLPPRALQYEDRLMLESFGHLQEQKVQIGRRIREISPRVKAILKHHFPTGLLSQGGYHMSVGTRTRNGVCTFKHVFQSIGLCNSITFTLCRYIYVDKQIF